ncbi:MAG: class II aldolase/adducin family protein [Dehalococcoidia bacterium]
MSRWQEEKRQVLEASLKMLDKGLVIGTSGNMSLRLSSEGGQDLLAITPNRRYYDLISVDDIQVIDFEAEPVEGDLVPSVETMLHIAIYQARKNINAVVHTHSVFASALAVAGMEIPAILDDQITFIGGEVKLARYALPGSQEMVDNALAALGKANAVLLANHGVLGIGRTMRDALTVCELVEKSAKIYISALTLGKVNPVPAEALEVQQAFFNMLQNDNM